MSTSSTAMNFPPVIGWRSRLAKEAASGHGIDALPEILIEIKEHYVGDDAGLRTAVDEMYDCAERHLCPQHKIETVAVIFDGIFPETLLDKAVVDEDRQAEIGRLAKLQPLEYARERKNAAKGFGVGVTALDVAVKTARARNADAIAGGQGRPIEFKQIEQWPHPIEGAALLAELSSVIEAYVKLSKHQVYAVALWVIHAHTHEASDVSPKLVLKSAQKRCGKSRLVTVVARIVPRGLHISGIKSAALLRIIETQCPTLLIDEMDATMKADREMAEALRGIINSGFDRAGARYIMNVPLPGGGYEPREFSTWAPQLLSGIGHLPDTVRDRSIEIEMIRKLQSEKVRRLRRKDGADLDELAQKSARWACDNLEALRNANPAIPIGLDDRAADAWEPLLAIAKTAGGEWPERARKAAQELSGEHVKEDDEIGTLLLADIREIFKTGDRDVYTTKEGERHIKSESVVAKLTAREDRPWAEFGRARKPITAIGLASLLRPYKIKPGSIRIGPGEDDTAKGYKLSQFIAIFERYLPDPKRSVTPSQLSDFNGFNGNQPVTSSATVTGENSKNASVINARDGVTGSTPESWEAEI